MQLLETQLTELGYTKVLHDALNALKDDQAAKVHAAKTAKGSSSGKGGKGDRSAPPARSSSSAGARATSAGATSSGTQAADIVGTAAATRAGTSEKSDPAVASEGSAMKRAPWDRTTSSGATSAGASGATSSGAQAADVAGTAAAVTSAFVKSEPTDASQGPAITHTTWHHSTSSWAPGAMYSGAQAADVAGSEAVTSATDKNPSRMPFTVGSWSRQEVVVKSEPTDASGGPTITLVGNAFAPPAATILGAPSATAASSAPTTAAADTWTSKAVHWHNEWWWAERKDGIVTYPLRWSDERKKWERV